MTLLALVSHSPWLPWQGLPNPVPAPGPLLTPQAPPCTPGSSSRSADETPPLPHSSRQNSRLSFPLTPLSLYSSPWKELPAWLHSSRLYRLACSWIFSFFNLILISITLVLELNEKVKQLACRRRHVKHGTSVPCPPFPSLNSHFQRQPLFHTFWMARLSSVSLVLNNTSNPDFLLFKTLSIASLRWKMKGCCPFL